MGNTPAATPGLRFERLDVLRAIAIIAVFLFHALGTVFPSNVLPWNSTGPDFAAVPHPAFLVHYGYSFGHLGVVLFFVISGFCIHWSFLRWQQDPRNREAGHAAFIRVFYWKRFWRIYPPYLLALLAWGLLNGYNLLGSHDLKILGVHATLLHNLNAGHIQAVNPVFWSLAVEMQLYAVYPLVMLVHRRFQLWGIVALILLIVAVRASGAIDHIANDRLRFAVGQLPFMYWPQWLAGTLAAEWIARGIQPGRWWGAVLLLATCAYPPATHLPGLSSWLLYAPPAIFTLAVWLFASDQRPLGSLERALVPVGLISYSLYMYHGVAFHPVNLLASPRTIWSPWWELSFGAIAGLLVTIAISWALYWGVEKKSEQLGARLLKHLQSRPPATTPPSAPPAR